MWSGQVEAVTITVDFNSLSNGQIVDNEFTSSHGLTISAINVDGGQNPAVIFDSDNVANKPNDSDLIAPPAEPRGCRQSGPKHSAGQSANHRNIRDMAQQGLSAVTREWPARPGCRRLPITILYGKGRDLSL